MTAGELSIVGLCILGFALVSRRAGRANVTVPMAMVALGWLTAAIGAVELDLEIELIVVLGEITLAVILFSDAVHIDLAALRADLGLPARLLVGGLPLSIGLGALLIAVLVPDLTIWEAALVSAILAPTDAALGQAVIDDPAVPLRVRQGLNVESGLNDGLVLPAVLLFLALSEGEEAEPGFWAEFVARQVGLGLLVGLVVGGAGAWLLGQARSGGWIGGIEAQLATLMLALTSFTAALAVGANGFLAAFAGGLTFGAVLDDHTAERVGEYTEDSGRLLATAAFFVFGNVLLHTYLSTPSIIVIVCAALTLTIGRIVPVALALATMRPALPTIAFVGWFGPRGLASILFGLILLEERPAENREFFALIAWTVLGSVVLHGLTAAPGARRYGEWFDSMGDSHHDMPEARPAAPMTQRPRGD